MSICPCTQKYDKIMKGNMIRTIYERSGDPNDLIHQSDDNYNSPRDPHYTPPLHKILNGHEPTV